MIQNFPPSLLHIAAVKIAVSLYKNNDIQDMVKEINNKVQDMVEEMENYIEPLFRIASFNRNISEIWEKTRKKAIEKIQGIVPTSLQNIVVVLLRPIHAEFESWIQDHLFVYVYTSDNSYKNDIYWACNGKINRIKTAKIFIRNQSFLSYARFLMACKYFLENENLTLWNEMLTLWNEIEHKTLYTTDSTLSVRFWFNWLKQGASTPLSQMIVELYKYARIRQKDARIKLSSFFHVLSPENRLNYLKSLDSDLTHEDDLPWCMHYVDEKKRVELLTTDSEGVLCSLLEWPFQNEFLLTAQKLWPYLTPDSFYNVLHKIVFDYVLKDFKYFDYFHLLKEFWQASPVSFRSNQEEIVIQLVEKLLNRDEESSPLTACEIEKEFNNFLAELVYQLFW